MTTSTATSSTVASTSDSPGGRHAMVWSSAGLVAACYGLARFAYGLFAPELSAEFDLDATVSGVIGAGSYVGYCVAIVASLALTPRWGPRRVAVLAGTVATVGTAVVALAPTASVLAAGVLLAGASTGIASPPVAAAVDRWVRSEARDRAQTVANAGTGIGVAVSGPVSLVLLDQWRLAWALFAVLSAAVTLVVARTVPSGGVAAGGDTHRPTTSWRLPAGAARLLPAAALMGAASIAVWTFGRELVDTVGHASGAEAAVTWTVLGVAGVLGALGGDLVSRVGLRRAWVGLLGGLVLATALLALWPGSLAVALVAAALFGASYIGLTGVVLLWSRQVFQGRVALGVGSSFLAIAVGQAVAAPVVGRLVDGVGARPAFLLWAVVGLVAGSILPRPGGDERGLT